MIRLAEFRFVIRGLSRTPAVALVVITTLAVAVAFNVAAASLLEALLLRPYRYPDLQQLMLVRDARPREGAHQGRPVAIADFLELRTAASAFSGLSAWRPQPLVVTNPGAEPERVEAAAVSSDFFATLGVTPLLGHTFQTDADQPGHNDVVLISRRLWASRFGAAPTAVGREVSVNGRQTLLAGIIRDEDCYPSGVDAWVPLVFTPSDRVERAAQTIGAIGRLAPMRTPADASAQLGSIAARLAGAYPLTNRERGFDILPMRREQYEFTAPMFAFVQAAALLVLLVAAINVTNLLAGRTLDRQRELVVRTLIGAPRSAIVGIVVCETLALSIVATALGMAGGRAILALVRASLPPGIARWVAGWSTMAVEGGSLVAGAGLGLATGVAIGAAVAVAALSTLAGTDASARTTQRRTWSRRALVGSEVGLTATLLLGASVMVNGLGRIETAFDTIVPERLLRFTLTLPEWRYPDASRINAFHAALLDALRAQSNVVSTALIRNQPASNVPSPTAAIQIEDLPAASPGDVPRADVQAVSPDVFSVLRVGIVDGRAFAVTDGFGTPGVAIVSREAERRFWGGRHAAGATIRLGTDPTPRRVVGVASDIKLNWYDPEMRPVVYVPDAQAPARTTAVLVRTRGDAAAAARQVRTVVAALDDRQPISGLESMTTTIADSLSPIRVIARMLIGGAVVSGLLATLGIYSVFAHWVRSRQRELGIRYALGATRPMIAWLVLREALGTASAGAAVGLAAGSAVIRLAGGALLGVPSVDTRALAAIAAAIVGITVIAAVRPARRASHVDVAALLRLE